MHNTLRTYAIRGAVALLLALLLLLPGRALAQNAEAPLRVEAGQQQRSDVVTLQRDIVIDGSVEGDVTSWLGDITVTGKVSGDVVSYSGAVVLAEGARVEGSVMRLAGAIEQHSGAQVAGQVIGEVPIGGMAASLLDASGRPLTTSAGWLSYSLLSALLALFTLAIALAAALVWPRRTANISGVLLRAPWRSLALGVVALLLLAQVLVLLAGVLALSLVGLLLLPPLLLLLHLPASYGLAVLAHVLVRRPGRGPERAVTPAALALTVGLMLLPIVLLGVLSPPGGLLLFYLLASAGLGAALLSRGGVLAPRTPGTQGGHEFTG
jgi:hypothetical protein